MGKISDSIPPVPIYTSDHLTKNTVDILNEAKELKEQKTVILVWT